MNRFEYKRRHLLLNNKLIKSEAIHYEQTALGIRCAGEAIAKSTKRKYTILFRSNLQVIFHFHNHRGLKEKSIKEIFYAFYKISLYISCFTFFKPKFIFVNSSLNKITGISSAHDRNRS